MSNSRRANAWGWIGLILVAGLIGAGFLYQQEGGRLFVPFGARDANGTAKRTQESPPERNQPKSTSQVIEPPAGTGLSSQGATAASGRRRSQPGIVNVYLKTEADHFLLPAGPWVYVDGRIVSDLNDKRPFKGISTSVSVKPGRHFVEAVAYGTHSGTPAVRTDFVLDTRGQHIDLEPGGEISLDFSFASLQFPYGQQNEFRGLLGSAGVSEAVPKDWRNWITLREVRAAQQMQLFESDGLTKVLKELNASFRRQPPKSSTVMLDIPQAYGGRREVNEFQVDIIVCWLVLKYWQDFPIIAPTIELNEDGEADLRAAVIPPVEKRIEQYLEQIQELQSISQQLRQAQ